MAIDSRAKRASAAGIALPFMLGVTPDATQPQAWRQTAGWGYYGILADAPAVFVPTFAVSPRYVPPKPSSNLTDLLRRQDNWIELEGAPTIVTPARLGNHFRIRLSEDCTVDPPHDPHNGQTITWRFEQPAAGGVTVTFNAAKFVTVMNNPIPVSETGSAVTYITATYEPEDAVWEIVGISSGATTSSTTTITTITTSTTLTLEQHVIFVDTSAGVVTLTLPAGSDGHEYIIKKITTPNSVVLDASGTEKVFGADTFTMDADEEVVTIIYNSGTTEWEVVNHHEWNIISSSTPSFPIMSSHDSTGNVSSDIYVPFGGSSIAGTSTIDRYQSVAPNYGTIHSLYVEGGDEPTAGNSWDITLYVNEVATGLTATIANGQIADSDLVTQVSVAPGDLLQWFIDETGADTIQLHISCVYDSTYQPLFGSFGLVGGSGTVYGTIQSGVSSTSEEMATLIPCAGTIRDFYIDDPNVDTAGDQVTYVLQSYDSGAGTWGDEVTIVHDFNTYGSSRTDLSSTLSVSAGDVLRWKVTNDSGLSCYPSVSCIFVPTVTGNKWVSGCLDQYDNSSSETGSAPFGSHDDTTFITDFEANCPVPLSGTASDLYMQLYAGPGAGKYITVALTKGGVATSLSATAYDTDKTGSDSSNSVAFTGGSNDMGVAIQNAGDTPTSQNWLAWGFVYRAAAGAGDGNVTYVTVGDVQVTSITASYVALNTDEMILVDTSSGDITITLPASTDGRTYVIKKTSASYTVTVQPASTELIDGETSLDITAAYTSLTVVGYGGDWYIR